MAAVTWTVRQWLVGDWDCEVHEWGKGANEAAGDGKRERKIAGVLVISWD